MIDALTLILAYYENPVMLQEQFHCWRSYPADLRARLHIIVVDDGSPCKPLQPQPLRCASLRMYRMKVDIPWNQDACRNLAAAQTTTRWMLMTDMDHLIPQTTLETLFVMPVARNSVYQFERVSAEALHPLRTTPYKHHPNTWLMTREVYEQVGGYDERFAGHYSTDGDFRARVMSLAPMIRLPLPIIRVGREVVRDASTTTLVRKSAEDGAAIKRIKEERSLCAPWRPLRGLTPWEQIL